MKNPFKWTGRPQRDLQGEARRYRFSQNLRALVVVLPVVAVLIVGLVLVARTPSQPKVQLTDWNKNRAFSGRHATDELMSVFQASTVAYHEYIKRDVSAPRLNHVEKAFEKVRSEAELQYALKELVRVSGDPYGIVLSAEQYETIDAVQSGKSIGVELDFDGEWGTNTFKVSRCPEGSDAYAAGLRRGDELVTLDDKHVDMFSTGNPWQTKEVIRGLLDRGLLGSQIRVVCKRDGVAVEAFVRRVVTGTSEPLQAGQIWSGGFGGGGQVEGGIQVRVVNMYDPTVVAKFLEILNRANEAHVKGILLDIQEVDGSDPEAPLRMAAMLMETGVIGHRIEVTPKGELQILTWEIKSSFGAPAVYLTTKGPYPIEDGAVNMTPGGKTLYPVQKQLDWPVHVFKGDVVCVTGFNTAGGGEVLAHALKQNLKRHVVVAGYLTRGKGMAQSYFQVGPEHVVGVSTSIYLDPKGLAIEGNRSRPQAIPPGGNADGAAEYGAELLNERLQTIPAPPQPPAIDPDADPDNKKKEEPPKK